MKINKTSIQIFIALMIPLTLSLILYTFIHTRENDLKTYKYRLRTRGDKYQYTDTFYTTDRFIIFTNHKEQKKMVPFEALFNITENY